MIGHFLGTLSIAQEDSLLTVRLAPHSTLHPDGSRCIIGAVAQVGTAANGWRREWDMEFHDGAPRWVTLVQFAPDGALTMNPAPQRIRAEHFFEEFTKEWGPLLGAGGHAT